MCNLCEMAKNNPAYINLLAKMTEEDISRMEATAAAAEKMQMLKRRIYSSIKWPLNLSYPMFDARTAYSVPNNYFQNLYLDGERQGVMFTHGAMRSVFFAGERLMLFSKSVNYKPGLNFFTSFVLLHLEPDEYDHKVAGDGTLTVSADVTKAMKNLITGKTEKKKVMFNFIHKPVRGRIMSREKILTSSQFRNVYARYGGAQLKSASIDMEGYALTVPHFAPHPYMLQLHEQFKHPTKRDFQEHAIDYFKTHLHFI